MTEKWAVENFGTVVTNYRATDIVYEKKTEFQDLQIIRTDQYGLMLLLDGIVQTTEKDEFVYHEMMTHVPLAIHPNPKKVLVIGGGDGGILREVLKHPGVEKAVLVEIDQSVIDLSKEYLPFISKGSFDHLKVQIVIDDGAKYVENPPEKFDVAIIDSPDPIGPATILFSQKFYSDVYNCLSENGVMARQSGSTFMQPAEQNQAFGLVKDIFEHCNLYVFNVPTYIGGLFSCVLGSKSVDPLFIGDETIEAGFKAISGATRYYNVGVHKGAFELPEYVRGILENGNQERD